MEPVPARLHHGLERYLGARNSRATPSGEGMLGPQKHVRANDGELRRTICSCPLGFERAVPSRGLQILASAITKVDCRDFP